MTLSLFGPDTRHPPAALPVVSTQSLLAWVWSHAAAPAAHAATRAAAPGGSHRPVSPAVTGAAYIVAPRAAHRTVARARVAHRLIQRGLYVEVDHLDPIAIAAPTPS